MEKLETIGSMVTEDSIVSILGSLLMHIGSQFRVWEPSSNGTENQHKREAAVRKNFTGTISPQPTVPTGFAAYDSGGVRRPASPDEKHMILDTSCVMKAAISILPYHWTSR